MHSFCKTATLVVLTSAVIAAPAAAQERGWLDVNLGLAFASEDTYTNELTFPFIPGTATFGVDYNLPRGASFDVGGGFMFTPRIGAGISFVGTAHEDVAILRGSIPVTPTVNETDSAETDVELRRTEGSVNLQVMAIVTEPGLPVDVRVFGGPTYFRVKQDTVDDIIFFDAPLEIVEFDLIEDVEANGWGFHVGADVRFFFNNIVGVGGVFRYSRGEVEIDGLFGEPTDIKVGGVQISGGLRLRF